MRKSWLYQLSRYGKGVCGGFITSAFFTSAKRFMILRQRADVGGHWLFRQLHYHIKHFLQISSHTPLGEMDVVATRFRPVSHLFDLFFARRRVEEKHARVKSEAGETSAANLLINNTCILKRWRKNACCTRREAWRYKCHFRSKSLCYSANVQYKWIDWDENKKAWPENLSFLTS